MCSGHDLLLQKQKKRTRPWTNALDRATSLKNPQYGCLWESDNTRKRAAASGEAAAQII